MADKEQIIIDGVNVSECAYFDYENEGTRECDAYGNECEANNCYFKQLARKTQECEELKETLNKLTRGVVMPVSEPEVIDLTARYRKALEEIEEIVKETCRKRCTNDCLGTRKHCGYGAIFNIINKAKGSNNDR